MALIELLHAQSPNGCSISNILDAPKVSLLDSEESNTCNAIIKTKMSKNLSSVKVLHDNKEIIIEREIVTKDLSCPPFCIEPMSIQDVVTVSELEVLAFIDKLKEKKARLLIDVRENTLYAGGTIPGAINLPLSMLKDGNKYQKEVLKLLGAKRRNNKWFFKNSQWLLIFGSSATTNEASSTIKKLLELGYPSTKLLYYRAGISSWKLLGLTVY